MAEGLRARCPEMMALLRHTDDSIFFKYRDGKFAIVSDAKGVRSGVSWEEMIGKTDFDFLPSEEAQRCWEDEIHVMETGESIINKEEELTRPDGSKSWVSVSKFPWMEDDEIVGVIGISRDISKQKRMERHILRMIAIATHDMKGMAFSISAYLLFLLKDKLIGEMSERVRGIVRNMLDKSKGLETVITDYLATASLMDCDGSANKEVLDLRHDIIDPVLKEISKDIEIRNIQIDNRLGAIPEDKILVSANKLWLGIVYRNLFSNAIKHTPNGGVIAYGFEDKGDFYQLNVFNNGDPIPPEKRELIFDMFESDNSSGIGLPIIRGLIQRHGGELWCEETWSGHPNFVFTLPKE